ncbi:uncharacterized protein LOC134243266 [Saccostrea cucullata]|uniref:uncharacterized protein LOC134243266 n=1 Tax=Saccostrea cuccullata TaxID=36930 RepID=UPI002ED2C7A4
MAEARPPGDYSDDEECDWMKAIHDSDVTIFYNEEDEYRIFKTILDNFDRENIKYICPGFCTEPGAHKYKNTAKAIQKSRKTLLILSESAKEVDFSLETYLALEQCLQTGRLSLMVLLIDGMTVQDLPKIPFLQQATQMVLVDNYHERCMETVCRTLKREVQLNQLLPAGNFAVGMAWSHFAGYLKLILPDLAQQIKKSDIFQNNLGRMSTVFFMLCPTSATGPRDIADVDPNVQNVGKVDLVINGRPFNPTIYKVKGRNKEGKEEEYFCCAEYPSALCALGLIADEVLNLLTPQQRRTEVERFKYKIEEILNHSRNEECMGRARVLMFDDEGKGERNTPSYNLFNGVRDAIEETMMKPLSDRQPSHVTRSQSNCSVDVCFLYSDIDAMENRTSVHSSPDNKTIKHIRMFLENKKIRCSIARPPVDSMGVIEERINDARWVCCLVSVNTVRRKDFIEFWLAALLNDCIEKNQLKIIILLKDLDSSFIPNFIQWVTYIDISNEPSFEERIYEIIKGDVVTLRSQVPAGNVAFGLAWAFHVNYLRHVLPDFNERLESRMEQDDIRKFTAIKKKFKVSRSLLELIPKSCEFKPLLTMADDRIQGPFEVKPIVKQMAATKRVFPCKLYRIESENCDYYFAGEMLTPMKALSEMHKSMIAGLSKKQMYEQCDALVEQLSAILDSAATPEEMQKKCRCIKYDDTQRKLSDVIMEEIDKEQSRDHVEMYASWLKKQEK